MGQRANIVVKRNGTWTLYYDHHAANSLDVELFFGPDIATTWAEEHDAVDTWMDDIWCEGAAIIDHDAKVLLWFGGTVEYDVVERKILAEVMQSYWPGWELRWAYQGLRDIQSYLDVPSTVVGEEPLSKPMLSMEPDHPLTDGVISVAFGRGIRCAPVCGTSENLLLGSAVVDLAVRLMDQHGRPEFEWKSPEPPVWGLHIEQDAQQVGMWTGDILDGVGKLEGAWTPWSVSWWKDDMDEHLALLGRHFTMPRISRETARASLLSTFKRIVTQDTDQAITDRPEYGLVSSEEDKAAAIRLRDRKLQMLDDAFSK